MATGTVKAWSRANGFGWIQPDGGGDRVYVHKSGVVRRDPERAAWLEPGERVEYQLGQRPKGTAAVNVRPAGDAAAAAAQVADAEPAEEATAKPEGSARKGRSKTARTARDGEGGEEAAPATAPVADPESATEA